MAKDPEVGQQASPPASPAGSAAREALVDRPWFPTAASAALAAGFCLHFMPRHWHSIYDDAYIYFRYAENVLAGCGATYNCGEPAVEGFTSPLYLALITALGAIAPAFETWSQIVGILFTGLALVTAARIAAFVAGASEGERATTRLARLAAPVLTVLVLGSDDFALLNISTGLETPLAAYCVSLTGLYALRSKRFELCVCLVLAVLSRPEAALLAIASVLLVPVRDKRFWLTLLGAGLLIEGLRYAVFGDLLPNTLYAKAAVSRQHLALGAGYLAETIRDFPAIVLAPLALLPSSSRRPAGALLVGSALWLAFFLYSGGDHFRYSRLAFPIVPLLTGLGVGGVRAFMLRYEPLGSTTKRQAIALGVPLLVALGISTRAWATHRLAVSRGFPNVVYWKYLGLRLGTEFPGRRLATVPIGAIGYYSKLPLIDLVGLTQREIGKYGQSLPSDLMRRNWIGHERHNTAWVAAHPPDIITFSRHFARPFASVAQVQAGFFAEWTLLRQIKSGRLPYRMWCPEILPGVFGLVFIHETLLSSGRYSAHLRHLAEGSDIQWMGVARGQRASEPA